MDNKTVRKRIRRKRLKQAELEKVIDTTIEWAERTWNPIVGCSKTSIGCQNCYAERMANRLKGMELKRDGAVAHVCGKYPPVITDGKWNGKTVNQYESLPKKPAKIFVSSMGDFFHESVTDNMHRMAFEEMWDNQQHTYILLTKRPERMRDYINFHSRFLPRRLWCGVTVCTQKEADEKIPVLLQVKTRVKFLSVEPMLEGISLRWIAAWERHDGTKTALKRDSVKYCGATSTDHLDGLRELSQIIVGGESGPGARPMHPDWVRSIRDQCREAGVPFLFKQWGEWAPGEYVEDDKKYPTKQLTDDEWFNCSDDWISEQDNGQILYRVGKKHSGRTLDGVTHNGYPDEN